MQHPTPDIAPAASKGKNQEPKSPASDTVRQVQMLRGDPSMAPLSAKRKLAAPAVLTDPAASQRDVTHAAFGNSHPEPPIVLLTGAQFDAQINHSRASRYDKLNPRSPRFDPAFPKPIKLNGTSIRFLQSEVNDWISSRIKASRGYAT
jgi:prophage regulatory protein